MNVRDYRHGDPAEADMCSIFFGLFFHSWKLNRIEILEKEYLNLFIRCVFNKEEERESYALYKQITKLLRTR